MTFKVTIIRNADRASVEITDTDLWDEGSEFRWTEGNDACDCNRAIQFLNARGELDSEQDHPCGDTLYSVTLPSPTPAMQANRI